MNDGTSLRSNDMQDRRYEICPPKQIQAWLRYDFHGRERDGNLRYSQFRWRPEHFNAVDWDQNTQENAIYKLIDDPSMADAPFQPPKRPFLDRRRSSGSFWRSVLPVSYSSMSSTKKPLPQRPGKGWAEDVDDEHGNNDYLMFSNIDYTRKDVREDVTYWGRWMVEDIGIHGFRLDAAQHFSYTFMRDWIQKVQDVNQPKRGKNIFVVGELWTGELQRITRWLDAVQLRHGPQVHAYDSPLLYNFSRLSNEMQRQKADLRTILHGSLLETRPEAAVTLVTNHDTQPGQTSFTPMDLDNKPLFYAFILLRQEGIPCVFWGDLFGTKGPLAEDPISDDRRRPTLLGNLMLARRLFAHGKQTDYCKGKSCIGWTREGSEHEYGCAVLIATGNPNMFHRIKMTLGKPGEVWVDVMGNWSHEVTIDEDGNGAFACSTGNVCIWIKKGAERTKRFPVQFDVEAGK